MHVPTRCGSALLLLSTAVACAGSGPSPATPAPVTESAVGGAPIDRAQDDGLQAISEDLRGLVIDRGHRPVVVALHGRGDHPTRFVRLAAGWADVATVVVPAAPTPYSSGFSWFSIRARSDNADLAAGVAEAARRVASLISSRRSDGVPVVVTGFSQGGMLSYALATGHPTLVDAAAPMGGFLPKGLWPDATPPSPPAIVAVHGDADPVIPVEQARSTVAHLQSIGWPVTLHEQPGAPHTVTSQMHQHIDQHVRQAVIARPSARIAPK